MSYQRRIDLLFATTVRGRMLARGVRKSGSVVAWVMAAGVAVHGASGWIRTPQSARFIEQPVFEAADVRSSAEHAWVTRESVEPPAPKVFAPRRARADVMLSQEQENVARFIAQQYRLTLDRTAEFVDHAYRTAREVKLDPLLVLAVMSVESNFNPKAQSHAGAQGLMQVLTRVHVEKFLPFGGIAAAFDPAVNIRVGSAILKEYLQREGSVEGALKSYVGAAFLAHDGGYGMKVLNARARIAAAAQGLPIPPVRSFVATRSGERAHALDEATAESAEGGALGTELPHDSEAKGPVSSVNTPTALSEPEGIGGTGVAL